MRIRKIETNRLKRAKFWLFAFCFPAFIIYTICWIIPVFMNFGLSLVKWNGFDWGQLKYVGLANFEKILHDKVFYIALKNNFVFVFATTIVIVVFSFLLALLIERGLPFKSFFRITFYLPVILPFIVVGLLWRWVYNPAFGILNPLLENLGLNFLVNDWISSSNTALMSVMIVGVWKASPFFMVIFLAALQKIPDELEEAARIDGATSFQILTKIVFPLLKPIFNIVIALNIVQGFRVFALIYAMTRGGPGRSTEVLPTYIIRVAFEEYNMGYSAALSVFLFILVFSISILFVTIQHNPKKVI